MTKKSLLGIICAVVFAGTSVFAQEAQESKDFGYSGTLLNPVNPRAAGMGMAAAAVNDNPFGIFGNAAANLFSEQDLGAGFSYNPWTPEVKGAASYAVGAYYNVDENNGISFGFRYGNQGKVAGVNPADLAVSVAYTRRIVDNFAISLTARYINANSYKMDDHKAANGVAFDLGLYYNNTIDSFFGSTWAVGLNVSNLGPELHFPDSGDCTMPAYATLGGSIDMPFSVNHRLLAAVDLGYTFMPSDAASFVASVGAEYNFLRYGIVRAGYHYGDELSMGGSYGTFGLGVKVGPVRVDASYWLAGKESPVKNTWSVGVGLFF